MKLDEAIEIVLQLARMGAIQDKEVLEDPEILDPEKEKQETAINTVHDYFVNNVFN
jgi:hypothetical protein